MDRRHVLKGIGVVALYGSFPTVLSEFLSSCKTKDRVQTASFFSDEEFSVLEQVCEILLPRTATPGALDVQVPAFVDMVVKDCMTKEDQQMIRQGLKELNDDDDTGFLSLNETERKKFVNAIDEKAFKDDGSKAWFRIIKKLAVIGYFTSQDGMNRALRYIKIPADYKACIPYKTGDKAMAKTFLMYY